MKSISIVLACATVAAPATMANTMPVAQQNQLVQRYCAVCHTDAAMNGLLSLQHFDAGKADPGVVAMLLSKLTNGLSPAEVTAAQNDSAAEAAVVKTIKTSAMAASGLPEPDVATQAALINAFALESTGASAWTVENGPVVRANLLRQIASVEYPGTTDMYRLSLLCRTDNHEGQMQLAWANGVPKNGRVVEVAMDRKAPFTYTVSGTEKMGNGTGGASGPGAAVIAKGKVALPAQTVTVTNLFPEETVAFSFAGLDKTARKSLGACFASR